MINRRTLAVIVAVAAYLGAGAASLATCDVNSDGEVDVGDVNVVLAYILDGNVAGGVDRERYEPRVIDLCTRQGGVSFTMVPVRGGTFLMGDNGVFAGASPAHNVTLSDYMICDIELTEELFGWIMGESHTSKLPAVWTSGDVTYYYHNGTLDLRGGYAVVDRFINDLNEFTGMNFRLPTEAEWEYAARGGVKSHGYRYAGSDNLDEVAWYPGNCGGVYHEPRGKMPNELGLYDMCGNAQEICSDWFTYYYPDYDEVNPKGPDAPDIVNGYSQGHAVRGGHIKSYGWYTEDPNAREEELRLAEWTVFFHLMPHLTNGRYGFCIRLACDMPEEGPEMPVRCDVNDDGAVDVGDVNVILAYILGGSSVTKTYTIGNVSFTMVDVEGGAFIMGDWRENKYGTPHLVKLGNFSIGQTEVTNALWEAVMGSLPYEEGTGPTIRARSFPVCGVKWSQCQEFIARLNELTGETFRLPTEAEWEYAARGGNRSRGYLYSGSDNLTDVGWGSKGNNSHRQPAMLAPNELGIYDMSGNVREWCDDAHNNYNREYKPWAQIHPTNSNPDADYHILRGGACDLTDNDNRCKVCYRDRELSSLAGLFNPYNVGLRLAK